MEDLTGKQLGPYQIVAPLGEGGMASIYKAYQPAVERYVALKILPRHFASDPRFVTRFEQEAKVIAKFQHPHILPVHDFGQEDGYTYIVMPYVEGGTLSGLLLGEPLPLEQIRRIISQVGDALDYAHALKVVHRDVKPSNILIDPRGNCLLTDFGIAKIVEGSVHITQTGAVVGTPAYMSPEQIQGFSLDGRSDVYSLGIVLYEMATGRLPFQADTPPAIFVKHINDPLPPPRQLNPAIPEAVETVIQKSLTKQPGDRYSSTAEMVKAIQAAIPGTVSQEPSSTETLVAEPIQKDGPLPETVRALKIPAQVPPQSRSRPASKRLLAISGGILGILGIIAVAAWIGTGGLGSFTADNPNPTQTRMVSEASSPTKSPAKSPTRTPTQSTVGIPPTGGCDDPIECVTYGPGEPIRITSALVISGPNTDLGTDSQYGVEIAIDFKGEILGHKIELQVEDDGCSAEGGQAAGQKIVSDP
ncbi:MAG: bifunctional serine/threonine-protein kinase/ABC transporter substrate-binding protein, partial [Anaerolineales bacterium]|nr:bifunctional serine/threonine-protein kinase/ABC transporter substrate-binding protein [Anaerolineales bacterium]